MNFARKKAIYLQIADFVCEQILLKQLEEGKKIASIREFAVSIEVNPNTITRTYSYLEENGIIEMQRGIGYFVAHGAYDLVVNIKRKEFLSQDLPQFFKSMKLLKIEIEQIIKQYHTRIE